ncbi:hypothetical protein BC939DRAFT_527754 [Gamsiella multidivaricata]|uniref:uncharacterized protein n=1 Tax=Gamsiella multidivaricata TaxID=101098 RepID=UPI0022200617|nr:uncharacterized protein BC939DRAFT_527754 [Gamsiella multidivaricata]KAG0361305.1 hypothetical protein BGZ54_009151 [Gamsiella multidivaricata]KAI7826214.1 hypothetical protein BC939DRAFT_527754 [Gamsiella multidivaricata]
MDLVKSDRMMTPEDSEDKELPARPEGQDMPEHRLHPNRVYFNGEPGSTFSIRPRTWKSFRGDGSFDLEARIPKGALQEGYYTIVWCISPKPLGQSLLKKLVFEVEVPQMKYKLWAEMSEAQIEAIDYLVEAPGRKLKMVDVRTCQQQFSDGVQFAPMAQIFAMDVSASGEYVAVLSSTLTTAYIGIWDLVTALPSTPDKSHDQRRRSNITSQPPLATFSIPLQEGQFNNMRLFKIALSSDGSSIAVYQQPRDDDFAPEEKILDNFSFPFRLFYVKANFTETQKLKELATTTVLIEDTSIHRSMAHFVGYGKFMAKDIFNGTRHNISTPADDSSAGDYFIACDESRIKIYDASERWERLYGIAIGGLCSMKSRTKQLRALFRSLEGPLFIWWEDAQNISIWDLATGANRKYISVTNPSSRVQNEIGLFSVSRRGKLLALAGSDWIRTYFMESGIEVCSTVIHGGRILDIQFLDEDKSLLVTTGNSSIEQTSVIMDALNLSFQRCAGRQFPSSTYSIQRVAKLSEGAALSHGMEHVMMAVNGNEMEVFAIPQPSLFSSGGHLANCDDGCANKESIELSNHVYQFPESNSEYRLVVNFEEREVDSRQRKVVRVVLVSVDQHGSVQQLLTIIPEPWMQFEEEDEDAEHYVQASFLASWSQFIILSSTGFQVWNLPDVTPDNRCELALTWVCPRSRNNGEVCSYAEPVLETRVCVHGEAILSVWFDDEANRSRTVCVRIPKNNWFSREETLYCINSIPMLISCYSDASASGQEAIIRYLVKHINHDPPEGTTTYNVMTKIAWASKWRGCSDIMGAIFSSTDGKWIPRCVSLGSVGGDSDGSPIKSPIYFLIKNAKKEPRSLPMAEQLIDYCIREAKLQQDPAFLLLVLDCLPLLVVYHPETAINIIRRAAFIPIKDRDFVVNNSVLAHPPRFGIDMANMAAVSRRRRPIYEYPNSVFQLKSQLPRICAKDFSSHIDVPEERSVDPLNETFKRHVYVAPYALLWHTRSNGTSTGKRDISTDVAMARMAFDLMVYKLNPLSRQTIRANFTELQYYDNPAVEALLEYKWNSFACMPWGLRFVGQLLYYALVLTVTLIQVYPNMMLTDLRGPLIIVVSMGCMFLYLELQQFLADHWKYVKTPYNVVDVLVFLLPVIGSIQLLINIPQVENTDKPGDSRVLSFSILFIYIHLLFEMRVIRSVCNIVTIILSIVIKIRVFFAIFALIVLAFTHSFLHLLLAENHDCITTDTNGNSISLLGTCFKRDTDFPGNFFGAISATYFFMAGRYDPVSKDLDGEDWAFHVMIAIYFFINVILLLNVLIALMNVAFSAGDNDGPLVWLDNRLRSVEAAENLSYAAPGLRQRFDWFPQYIYYTASPRTVQAYKNKYPFLIDRDDNLQPQVHQHSIVITPVRSPSPGWQLDQLTTEAAVPAVQEQNENADSSDGAAVDLSLAGQQSMKSPRIPYSLTETTVIGSPLATSSEYSRQNTGTGNYFADFQSIASTIPQSEGGAKLVQSPLEQLPSRPQPQPQPPRTRQRRPSRQSTTRTINFLRSANDQDGNGVDDKFERDEEEISESGQGVDVSNDALFAQDHVSILSRVNQDERQRLMETELRTLQTNTEQLRENMKGIESKLDQMTLMLELLLRQSPQRPS